VSRPQQRLALQTNSSARSSQRTTSDQNDGSRAPIPCASQSVQHALGGRLCSHAGRRVMAALSTRSVPDTTGKKAGKRSAGTRRCSVRITCRLGRQEIVP